MPCPYRPKTATDTHSLALVDNMEYQYLVVASGALLAWLASITIYRLCLSPLAKIPGPWLPAVTEWYSTYYDCFYCGGGQYPFKIKKLHEQYGPIIRISPRHVHISDPDFLDTIYAMRDRNSVVGSGLMIDQSMAATEDFALHRLRREALSPYFSSKAITEMEPLLAKKALRMGAEMDRHSGQPQPVNLSDLFYAFSNDVLRSFCFGSDNGLLNNLDEAKQQRMDLTMLLRGVPIGTHFKHFIRFVSMVMVILRGQEALPPAVRNLVAFRSRALETIKVILADKTNDRKGATRSVFYELRDSPILPLKEKTVARLQDEATILVMAGTRSPADLLTMAAFHLASEPTMLMRLRDELRAAKARTGQKQLLVGALYSCQYLQAIILEANRLSLGITIRMQRYSPSAPLMYTASYGPHKGDIYAIPPRTVMSTLTWCTHTNETLFPDPLRFDPERWLGDSDIVNKRKRCMHSFGKGHRRCLGMNLANASLSLALAEIAQYDIDLFDTTEEDVAFKYDYQVAQPHLESKGVRVMVKSRVQ
jgi:cytochrome P450